MLTPLNFPALFHRRDAEVAETTFRFSPFVFVNVHLHIHEPFPSLPLFQPLLEAETGQKTVDIVFQWLVPRLMPVLPLNAR